MAQVISNRYKYQIQIFIDSEVDRKTLYQAMELYQKNHDIQSFASSLKRLLNRPERLRIYDLLRPWVLPQHQMDYNILVPYVNNRQRTIHLNRRKGGPSTYGFSIRGGCEHGIGIYVSEVVEGSMAFNKGLKVGDQIIRINGLSIDQCIHEEVLNLIAKSKTLVLKVKSVGMIPVRSDEEDETKSFLDELPVISPPLSPTFGDGNNSVYYKPTRRKSISSTVSSRSEALSWVMVDNSAKLKFTNSSGDFNSRNMNEIKIFVDVSKTQKFGCSICKGPADFPGIFIQSTSVGGVAQEVGLETGDQILSANGRNLNAVAFQEAVEYLKSTKRVELLVKKGVGVHLFAGPPVNGDVNYADSVSTPSDNVKNELENDAIKAEVEETVESVIMEPEPVEKFEEKNEVREEKIEIREEKFEIREEEKEEEADSFFERPSFFSPTLITKIEMEDEEDARERRLKEQAEELQRQREYASKLEAKKKDEAVVDLIHSASGLQKMSLAADSPLSPLDLQRLELIHENGLKEAEANSRASSVSSHGVEESVEAIPAKRKAAVWMKTPLADIHNSPEPSVYRSIEDNDNLAANNEELRSSHATEEKPTVAELPGRKERKSVSFAVEAIPESPEAERKKSTGSNGDERKQSVVFTIKPTPHMFVDPKESENVTVVEWTPKKKTSVVSVAPSVEATSRKPTSKKNITDSSSAPPKPPDFFFTNKPKITISSYGEKERLKQQPPQHISYLQPKLNHITIESKSSSGPVKVANGVGNEAKPLKQTQLSVAPTPTPKKEPEPIVSSFSAARAKFMINSMNQEMSTSLVKKSNGEPSKGNKPNVNGVQNGHKISIRIPDEQIVIVKKSNY